MRLQRLLYIIIVTLSLALTSCHDGDNPNAEPPAGKPVAIKEDSLTYTAGDVTLKGFVAYDSNSTDRKPIVFVVHEWWGLTDYPRKRAKQLAELGYVAMSVDMFGNGRTTGSPDTAQTLAGPFYQDVQLAKTRFDAAVAKGQTLAQVDTSKMAAIGYCFGGGVLLNLARLGQNLDGVASFHGSLLGTPASKELLKAKLLVCNGEADPMVPKTDVDLFRKQMDSIGAGYTFKNYPGALHAFTNPDATAIGKKFNLPIAYDAAADSASWKELKDFLGTVFK